MKIVKHIECEHCAQYGANGHERWWIESPIGERHIIFDSATDVPKQIDFNSIPLAVLRRIYRMPVIALTRAVNARLFGKDVDLNTLRRWAEDAERAFGYEPQRGTE